MPHCILEHSDNIKDNPSWENIFSELHNTLVNIGGWNISDFKSRVIIHDNYFIGDGKPNQAFITNIRWTQ